MYRFKQNEDYKFLEFFWGDISIEGADFTIKLNGYYFLRATFSVPFQN